MMRKPRPMTDMGTLRLLGGMLAAVVILPTVVLLWFMSQAVRNERLAVRDKLVRYYDQKLREAVGRSEEEWAAISDSAKGVLNRPVKSACESADALLQDFDGVVIYGRDGRLLYPAAVNTGGAELRQGVFRDAWRLEYLNHDYTRAADRYRQLAEGVSLEPRVIAKIGEARCLRLLGRAEAALEAVNSAANDPEIRYANSDCLLKLGQARLMRIEIAAELLKSKQGGLEAASDWLSGILYIERESQSGAMLATEQKVFLVRQAIEVLQKAGVRQSKEAGQGVDFESAKKMIAGWEASRSLLPIVPEAWGQGDWTENQVRMAGVNGGSHAVLGVKGAERSAILVCDRQVAQWREAMVRDLSDTDVVCHVFNGAGYYEGQKADDGAEVFLQSSPGVMFPGWRIEMAFRNNTVFDEAAKRHAGVYLWTGALAIVLMVAVGVLAGRVVGRQIRLNRLKNDFIANVTHELKTPLSSMRVLVDTLLEGRCTSDQQEREYLQLISNENGRLSRLIDNFLTFSRMERNKQAFMLESCLPGEIARLAAEAVGTKYSNGHGSLRVSISDDLPEVQADCDAMVTVLINLLDNAYKYSYDDKRVVLNVYLEGECVCFSVKDNGVGMTRRQIGRIFDRFYQADNTLTRRVGGTGLGLSIVKFIVDAHKGKITVDSKPGKGSEFVVKLMA